MPKKSVDYQVQDSRHRRLNKEKTILNSDQREFELKTKITDKINYWWINTSYWRFGFKRIPKNSVVSFVVMLRKAVPKDVVDRKLHEAFGDSK